MRAWRRWSGGFSAIGALFLQQKLLQELKINVDLRPPGLVNTPIMELEFPFNMFLWLLVPGHFDLLFLSFWSSCFSPFLPPAATTESQTVVDVRACCVWGGSIRKDSSLDITFHLRGASRLWAVSPCEELSRCSEQPVPWEPARLSPVTTTSTFNQC